MGSNCAHLLLRYSYAYVIPLTNDAQCRHLTNLWPPHFVLCIAVAAPKLPPKKDSNNGAYFAWLLQRETHWTHVDRQVQYWFRSKIELNEKKKKIPHFWNPRIIGIVALLIHLLVRDVQCLPIGWRTWKIWHHFHLIHKIRWEMPWWPLKIDDKFQLLLIIHTNSHGTNLIYMECG